MLALWTVAVESVRVTVKLARIGGRTMVNDALMLAWGESIPIHRTRPWPEIDPETEPNARSMLADTVALTDPPEKLTGGPESSTNLLMVKPANHPALRVPQTFFSWNCAPANELPKLLHELLRQCVIVSPEPSAALKCMNMSSISSLEHWLAGFGTAMHEPPALCNLRCAFSTRSWSRRVFGAKVFGWPARPPSFRAKPTFTRSAKVRSPSLYKCRRAALANQLARSAEVVSRLKP
mmetsp:Transcript_48331/g.147033  ORF Transcript_48331/g.147033 Transcript_48331/m.147033 type:complete len:236 (+) Transcript_48331:53-760(+)